MPKCVYAAGVQGATLPARSLRPLNGVWADWCAAQGIDHVMVEQVEVTEQDDGSLIAYCTRREMSEDGRITTYPPDAEGYIARTYFTHHPVTSIQALLDCSFPELTPA